MNGMKKQTVILIALLSALLQPVMGADFSIDREILSLSDAGQTPFVICSGDAGKAFYGSYEQNLGYDDLSVALLQTNATICFRLEASGTGWLLRALTPGGSEYNIWGSPGYLNTQPADQKCSFILGLKDQNGQDFPNGALWDIQYAEGKGFSLRNVGTGLYLHDAGPAKYEEPAFFRFYTLREADGEGVRNVLDISGDNTSSSYVSHSQAIRLPANDTLDVLMARYCYFSSPVTGAGVLRLYAGGERCYLGTAKGAQWPDWSGYTGDIHIRPYRENSPSAGSFGVVLAHGGKAFSAENIEEGIRSGKANNSMENNRVTLHSGTVMCCEANTAGAGFRIGELQTEAGSSIIGYMKKNTRAAQFIVGCLGTDATLAGTIAPPDYSDTHPVGLIKEGKGTYRLTANNNYLSGALRVLEGRVLVMNDRAEAESRKLRGALGAKPDDADPIAYIFENGILGGTGSIGGTVDNYGTIAPGEDTIGTLTLKNYAAARNANLCVRPASRLRFRIAANGSCDRLVADGAVKYSNIAQDFTASDKMPLIQLVLDDGISLKVGDEFTLLQARSKTSAAGDWQFSLLRPSRYTWQVVEQETDGGYTVSVRVISLEDQQGGGDDPDNPGGESGQMGPFYDDGIDDAADNTTLREYAARNGKRIGTAISMWKNDLTNPSLGETQETGTQFSMLVAENEMKFDALRPSRNEFNYGAADNLVNFALEHNMTVRGHCLAWHSQVAAWVSSDGKKNDRNWSRDEALKILEEHITQVMTHFRGRVTEWDVVNECLDDDQTTVRTNPDGYDLRRESVWTRAVGEGFIDSAFVYAHRADPDAKLYLNDYGVELQGKAKSAAFYNLALRLKQSGIPLDGVGLQCHFSVGDVDSVKLAATFEKFAEAGLNCIVTELDMGIPSTSEEQLLEQARNYRVVTDIVLNSSNSPHMVIWGLKDNNSWREASSPLLYNAGLGRKPAWYAVRSALRHRVLGNNPEALDKTVTDVGSAICYDLQGHRVGRPTHGLYVMNGKKVLF